jgi:hypothetical protein
MKSKEKLISAVSYKDSEVVQNLMQKLTKTDQNRNEIDFIRPIMMG